MKTIIFKSEKNAKVYEIRSAKNQGVYSQNELVRIVKTDNISNVISDSQYEYTVEELKYK